jgi:hypothetical protein
MRAEEVMAAAGFKSHGREIKDAWIKVRCPFDGTKQRLDALELRETGQQTDYLCGKCGRPIVTVGPAPGLVGGYRLGDYIVNPLGGMEIDVPGS